MEKRKVLIVDDDEGFREALAYEFDRRGYSVRSAADGDQALVLVKENKFDLILSDVQMPNKNGVQLLDDVRKLNDHIPVFMFITGFADLSLEDAYAHGANALFTKPFDRKTLWDAVIRAALPKEELLKEPSLRLATDLDIEIRYSHETKSGKVVNIGKGGMFVALDGNLPTVGRTIDFNVNLHEGNPGFITGTGEVKWTRDEVLPGCPAGVGVEFKSFDRNFP